MAHAYSTHGPEVLAGGALRYRVYESEVQTGSEWSITLPSGGEWHVLRVQCDIEVADGVSTVEPELGELASWTSEGRGHIAKADAAAANVRIGDYKNFYAREGRLYGRSVPDANGGAANRIETFITIKPGDAI